MSAVDFVDNTNRSDVHRRLLSNKGFDDRALQVYRQAASLAPLQPEPYMLGLRAARETKDTEGLKWASLGILSQAWPKEQASVWQKGMGVATEVLEKLRSEKRTKGSRRFRGGAERSRSTRLRGPLSNGPAKARSISWSRSPVERYVPCATREARAAAYCWANGRRQTGRDNLAVTARSMFVPRDSTAPTRCWCGAFGQTSRQAR